MRRWKRFLSGSLHTNGFECSIVTGRVRELPDPYKLRSVIKNLKMKNATGFFIFSFLEPNPNLQKEVRILALNDLTPETLAPPRHIAIIMDGNGRWAKKRGLPRTAGHAAGAEAFRRIAN